MLNHWTLWQSAWSRPTQAPMHRETWQPHSLEEQRAFARQLLRHGPTRPVRIRVSVHHR
jgi:hypothetical protein